LSVIRGKHQYFRSVKTRAERHDKLVVVPLLHPDSILQGRAFNGILEACLPRTMLGIPPSPLPHLVHTIIRYVEHRPYVIDFFLGDNVVWIP